MRPELKALCAKLDVERVLRGWRTAVKHAISEVKESKSAKSNFFLLVLRMAPDETILTIDTFSKERLVEAQRQYSKIEKDTFDDPKVQAVLVSVDSIRALPRAYPNYFLDTEAFIREVRLAIQK